MFNNDGVIVEFKGNVGRDPEMRYVPSGDAVTKLSVGVNRRYTNRQTNAQVEETTWVRCTLWGKAAEAANQYLEKGQTVTVRGRLEMDKATGGPRLYQRQDGTMGASFEVRVLKIDYGQKAGTRMVATAGASSASTPASASTPIEEDDIPF